MKKDKSLRAAVALMWMLLVAALAVPVGATAQTVDFKDDFDYNVGELHGQGNWLIFASNAKNPIEVVENSLTYSGYTDADNAPTKSVKLASLSTTDQDLVKRFTTESDGITSGTVYYSALINVTKAPEIKNADSGTGNVYVLALVPRTKSKEITADNFSATDLGRLFIGKSDNADEVKVGISRGNTTINFAEKTLKLNTTYLVVVKYTIESLGASGVQKADLYVNPAIASNEPANADAHSEDGSRASYGLQGIELRQGTNASNAAPEMYVGSLRVSDTFGGLFGKSETSTDPTLKVPTTVKFDANFAENEDEKTIDVKGSNLKGDVTVECNSDAITLSSTTLAAADVMSETGAPLTVKLKYTAGDGSAQITFKTEGAEDIVTDVTWEGVATTKLATLKEIYSQEATGETAFKYTGEAVVTFIDKGQTHPYYYLQDESGAMAMSTFTDMSKEYSIGDKVTGTIFSLTTMNSNIIAQQLTGDLGTTVSTGNATTPVEVTLAELKATPGNYIEQLVKVSGLKFKDVAEGATFAEGMTQPVVTDGENEANVRIFKGTSLIGTDIPTDEVSLTGLFTSSSMIIGPRGAEDIVKAPVITVTPDEAFAQVAGVKGKSVEVGTIHISAKNMTEPTTLSILGAAADVFSLSQTEIAAGSSETDITVTYTPDEVKVHKAYVSIECPSIANYSKLITISGYAIDEKNPPVVAVDPTTIPEFKVKAGEETDVMVKVTSANLPDYLYAKLKYTGEEANGFVLGSSMFLRNCTNTLKVSFSNEKEGTYTNAIIFYSLGMEEVEVPLTATVTGETPAEEKEGQSLDLSKENPLKVLNETFDNVEKNKPIALTGWVNNAYEGTRAWWGYTMPDYDTESAGQHVAKVTPYDSSIESGKGTEMVTLLVTPALDFKNAATKVFTFKVRGDYLQDNQADKLELCYITAEGDNISISAMPECVMPSTKDESGKWYPYTVNLTGQDVDDVFFIGFRFTGIRGCDNSATYYVDDVTWGVAEPSGIDGIATNGAADSQKVYDLSGNMVGDSTKALAPGMYIVKSVAAGKVSTKKVMVK